jgi:spermidine/putrescine-binding protein
MRTIKALACAAALAAGLATAVAQSNVYSLNVVGYYNVTVPQNQYYLIANQLNTTNNQIQFVIPTAANDTLISKYNGVGYDTAQFEDYNPGWDLGTMTLNPGEAALFKDPNTAGGQTVTFVGEVLQGQLTVNFVQNHVAFRSSKVPQSATLAALGIPGENDDLCSTWNGGGWSTTQFEDYNPGWDVGAAGVGPTLAVGQGFAYVKQGTASTSWVRNFTVQ